MQLQCLEIARSMPTYPSSNGVGQKVDQAEENISANLFTIQLCMSGCNFLPCATKFFNLGSWICLIIFLAYNWESSGGKGKTTRRKCFLVV